MKIDLHTHSIASPDGGLRAKDYDWLLNKKILDIIAITDHNRIDFALEQQQLHGDKIIVGEEIMTTAGEIIGLYLQKRVAPGLTPHETVAEIQSQGGIVYLPHPFETTRKGLQQNVLDEIEDHIAIVEVFNGRALFQNKSAEAVVWARLHNKLQAASSDAHGRSGAGRTFTQLKSLPTKETLLALLAQGVCHAGRPPLVSLLYPKYNTIRKKVLK